MNLFWVRPTVLAFQLSLFVGTSPLPSLASRQPVAMDRLIPPGDKTSTDIAGLTVNRMPDHSVIISWTTEKEGKDDYYDIERSNDGKAWTTVAVAMAGTGIEDNSYEYIDKQAAATSLFYRIRQRNADGKYSFSAVTTVEGETRAAASIFFADKTINIRLYGQVKEELDLRVLDAAGNILLQRKYNDFAAIIRLSVADLASGRYTLNLRDAVGIVGTKKFVIR